MSPRRRVQQVHRRHRPLGQRFVITWHPGRPDGPATEVEVRFDAAGAGTKVVLEHRNWEVLPEPAAAREEYGNGWPGVLAAHQAHTAPVWVALLHTLGPGSRPSR